MHILVLAVCQLALRCGVSEPRLRGYCEVCEPPLVGGLAKPCVGAPPRLYTDVSCLGRALAALAVWWSSGGVVPLSSCPLAADLCREAGRIRWSLPVSGMTCTYTRPGGVSGPTVSIGVQRRFDPTPLHSVPLVCREAALAVFSSANSDELLPSFLCGSRPRSGCGVVLWSLRPRGCGTRCRVWCGLFVRSCLVAAVVQEGSAVQFLQRLFGIS